MRETFVISDRESIYRMFVTELKGIPVHFTWVGDMDRAEEAFKREKPDFVFFAVRDKKRMHNWLARYKKLQLKLPFICFLGHAQWDERELLWMSGATEVIGLPALRKEFRIIIENILKRPVSQNGITQKFEGALSKYALMDLIQSLEDGRQNGVLTLYNGDLKGDIIFNKGAVVHARLEDFEPLLALQMMAQWQNGSFSFEADKINHKATIKLNNQQIYRECQKYQQKYEKAVAAIPDKEIVFYTSPLLDWEQVGPQARVYLRYFKEGLTPVDFLDQYGNGLLRQAENLNAWIKNGWLIKRSAFNRQMAQLEEEQNRGGMSRIFQRVFNRQKNTGAIDYNLELKTTGENEDSDLLYRRPWVFHLWERVDRFNALMENDDE
ncbi:MAG: DUF4388 domain-containing protein [Calditrichaeota bacterium]|nr:MAG: DUF4388 domain-containing protein [Calditrichota bacterium]